jgi:DNA-binding winged helix-turn-helix (wHTH) protein/tetratricopeptide (TPR) repeat protein
MSRYRFGPFELDAESGALHKHGSRVRLQKQPFQILLTLIQRSGHVVTRNELRQAVWGADTFVDFEHGLNAAVNKIRRALGDSSDHAIYIETLPGEGYRFVSPIAEQPSKAAIHASSTQAAPAEEHSNPESVNPGPVTPNARVPVRVVAARRGPRFAAAVAAAVGLLLIGSFTLHKPPKLTDKDTVVLADFTNSTGDAEFNDMLREALAIQLEESPFLKVLDDERVGEDLQLMRRPPGTQITNGLAREICQRENEKAMIHGSIANLGKTFSITLQATDCQSGGVLAREQAESPDKERALEAVSTAARGLRAKLGESLTSIRQTSPSGDRVTTISLAAFQTFGLGAAQFRRGNYNAAIPVFQHAVELDPEFSTAWLYLGISYQSSGDTGEHMSEALKRAFDMRGRVPEREHLFASSMYYYYVLHDFEKARASSELWSHLYPRNYVAENLLGNVFGQEGNLEEALREYQRADELATSAVVKSNLTRALIRLNRFDDATAYIRKEFARNTDNTVLHRNALQLALMHSDDTSARREMQWFSTKPAEYLSLEAQAANAFVRGQRHRQEELLREARQMRTHLSLAVPAFSPAEEDALTGTCDSTRRENRGSAVALALCADGPQVTSALKNAEKAAAARPYDADIALADLLVRAAAELSQNHPAAAIEQLRSSSRIERRHPEVIYLRGLACLRLHKGAEAAAEFRKIVDHKGTYWGPYYPVSYVALARSEVLAGDMPKARQTWQEFLALWRDADPDIPILRQARLEYGALQ